MCSPPTEVSVYWTDEQIISFLDDYTPGSQLPDHVVADPWPYLFGPSNLPEGIWYLVDSDEDKESVYGFWKVKGEACKIYSDSRIIGWRTCLEYFEGGQRTNWLMQKYSVTRMELPDEDNKPKDIVPRSLLCRLFQNSESEPKPKDSVTNIDPVALVNPSNTKALGEGSAGEDDLDELDCFLRGDYLELKDLEDSSSSQNSSCASKLSEESFGSAAFLRDIEEEGKKMLREHHSTSRYTFPSSPFLRDDVVLPPPSSGQVVDVSHETDSDSSGGDKKATSRIKKLKTYFCFASF